MHYKEGSIVGRILFLLFFISVLIFGMDRSLRGAEEEPLIIYFDEEGNEIGQAGGSAPSSEPGESGAQEGSEESASQESASPQGEEETASQESAGSEGAGEESLEGSSESPSESSSETPSQEGQESGVEEVIVIDPVEEGETPPSAEEGEEIDEPWSPLYLPGEEKEEEVFVIGEASPWGELVDLKEPPLVENQSERRRYHDQLFAIDKGAPLLLGDAFVVADVRVKESGEVLPAGEEVKVFETVDFVSITDRGTINSGALSPAWEGTWWKQLYTDSIYSTRFVGLVYSYGLQIPSSLRWILSNYSLTLRNVFLDKDLMNIQGNEYASDGLTGKTLGFVTVTPTDEHLFYLACIPAHMEWVFFHEFGHALDIQYFYHKGRFLSSEPETQALLEKEEEAFEANLPLVSEHSDNISELFAEMVSAYFCSPELLKEHCPGMYALVEGLTQTTREDWEVAIPGSWDSFFYGCSLGR